MSQLQKQSVDQDDTLTSKLLRRRSPIDLLFGFLLISLSLIILLPMVRQPPALPSRDSGTFLYTGWRILEGDLPYRDLWDHKPPLIFYINALGLFWGNGSTAGVHGYEAASLVIATLLGYILLSRAFGKLAAFVGSLLWLLTLVLVLEGGNFTEEFALPLQFLALLSFVKAEKEGKYTWQGPMIGFALSLALLLRPNQVAIWIAIILYIIVDGLRNPERKTIRTVGIIFAAFATGVGLLLLPLIIHNQLGSFWEAVFTTNWAFAATTAGNRLQALGVGIEALSRSGLLILSLIGVLIVPFHNLFVREGMEKATNSPLLGVALVAFPIEVAFSTIVGTGYLHYFISWLPISTVLATYTLSVVLKFTNQFKRARSLITIISLSVIVVRAARQPAALLKHQLHRDIYAGTLEDQKLIEYIRTSTSYDDYVLVWGHEAGVNFVVHRKAPTRYFHQYPLFAPYPHYRNVAEEFYRDIIAHKPAIIVETSPSNRRVPPLDKQAENGSPDISSFSHLRPFLDYVWDNYVLVGKMGAKKWLVYQYAP